MDTIKTKDGDLDVKQPGLSSDSRPRLNKHRGEVEITDERSGTTVRLLPTFEAALEIEDAIGGLDGVRIRIVTSGMPGIASPTARELGVIIAAGARASATSVPARPPRRVRLLGRQERAAQAAVRFPLCLDARRTAARGRLGKQGIAERLARRQRHRETAELMTELATRSAGSKIAIVELGWSPDYFWRATVPEFWAGVDWIAERNLDAEEQD